MQEIVSRNININRTKGVRSTVYTTPEQRTAYPDHYKYAYSEIFRELLDAMDISYNTLGEADYLLCLKKDLRDRDLMTYTATLYPIEITNDMFVKQPAWWKTSSLVEPVTLPDGSVRKQHYQCTNCYNISDRSYRYCPHCGAAMQGVK